MSKKVMYRYALVSKATNEVIWDNIATREFAREEKRFLKAFDKVDAKIRQDVYILDTQRTVR
jgi:cytochrome c556